MREASLPRRDRNHPSPPRRHHKAMHSGRKGKGGDAKIKEAKQVAGASRHPGRHRKTGNENR